MTEGSKQENTGEEETVVCIGCAKPMPASADFCPHCGAPNGPYCWWDPWKRIFASGHVYRRMTGGPLTRFVAVAVLLLLVGMIVALFFGAVEMQRQAGRDDPGLFLPALGTLAMACVLVFFVRRVLLNYLRQKEAKNDVPADDEKDGEA